MFIVLFFSKEYLDDYPGEKLFEYFFQHYLYLVKNCSSKVLILETLFSEFAKEEGKIEVAKNFLDMADDETIAKKPGLDIELIKKLRAENYTKGWQGRKI
ncbi:hypothetical protein KPL42_01485 [Clostridium gasigenes]|uniref:hypothetical protein n=1 Tax=Clostridium gasigenes TaxID=94869 RepID=UPI001C0E65EC|nr:hypothetical protein [Clostridium gasigenes]MBU3087156.1 hypothetical protein [Clostridium gasigenes]